MAASGFRNRLEAIDRTSRMSTRGLSANVGTTLIHFLGGI